MDLMSWSWGQSTGARTSRGAQPDNCIQDLHFVKEIDSASPTLITNSVLGQVARQAQLVVRRNGESGPEDVLRLTLHNVTVTSYQTGAGGFLPVDQVTLHFESMDGTYYKQNFNGNPTPVTFSITTGAANCR